MTLKCKKNLILYFLFFLWGNWSIRVKTITVRKSHPDSKVLVDKIWPASDMSTQSMWNDGTWMVHWESSVAFWETGHCIVRTLFSSGWGYFASSPLSGLSLIWCRLLVAQIWLTGVDHPVPSFQGILYVSRNIPGTILLSGQGDGVCPLGSFFWTWGYNHAKTLWLHLIGRTPIVSCP